MKVQELIEKLAMMPQNATVYVPGYEDGVDDLTMLVLAGIERDVNEEHFYGHHDLSDDGEPGVILRGRHWKVE